MYLLSFITVAKYEVSLSILKYIKPTFIYTNGTLRYLKVVIPKFRGQGQLFGPCIIKPRTKP
jgi:hypothetical protein